MLINKISTPLGVFLYLPLGYHVYNGVWTVTVGQILRCACKTGNVADHCTVSVLKDSKIVSHLPKKVLKVYSFFLRHGGSPEEVVNMGNIDRVKFTLVFYEVYISRIDQLQGLHFILYLLWQHTGKTTVLERLRPCRANNGCLVLRTSDSPKISLANTTQNCLQHKPEYKGMTFSVTQIVISHEYH